MRILEVISGCISNSATSLLVSIEKAVREVLDAVELVAAPEHA
jgi:hypothetical protein